MNSVTFRPYSEDDQRLIRGLADKFRATFPTPDAAIAARESGQMVCSLDEYVRYQDLAQRLVVKTTQGELVNLNMAFVDPDDWREGLRFMGVRLVAA